MGHIYKEHRGLHAGTLSLDVARHLYTRTSISGKVVILTQKPKETASSVMKQWRVLLRSVQRERGSTLNRSRILSLVDAGARMQHLHITGEAKPRQEWRVLLIRPEQLQVLPPDIHTLYVTCPIDEETKKRLIEQMPPRSLLVQY